MPKRSIDGSKFTWHHWVLKELASTHKPMSDISHNYQMAQMIWPEASRLLV
jgi:hypothetical protein